MDKEVEEMSSAELAEESLRLEREALAVERERLAAARAHLEAEARLARGRQPSRLFAVLALALALFSFAGGTYVGKVFAESSRKQQQDRRRDEALAKVEVPAAPADGAAAEKNGHTNVAVVVFQ